MSGYVVREDGNRVEGYALATDGTGKRIPLTPSPILRRVVDRVDSPIVHRLPGDTSKALAANEIELCGDGYSYTARLTVGAIERRTGAGSCADRSPGSSRRLMLLRGIVDSLAQLTRPR